MSNVEEVVLDEQLEKQLEEVIAVEAVVDTKEQKSKNEKYHTDRLNGFRKNGFYYDLYNRYGLEFDAVPFNLSSDYRRWYDLIKGTKQDPYHLKPKEVVIKKAKRQERQVERAKAKRALQEELDEFIDNKHAFKG